MNNNNSNSITIRAYAKINLSLDVVGRRPNGYHDIESVMQGVDLCDIVTIQWLGRRSFADDDLDDTAGGEARRSFAKAGDTAADGEARRSFADSVEIELEQNVEGLPTDRRNLAIRGAEAFLQALETRAGGETSQGGEKSQGGETSRTVCETSQGGENSRAGCETSRAVCETSQGGETSRLKISIDKRLPIAAGIAGGSGNAAAVMLGMNALAGNPFTLRELMEIGAGIGADVPFSIFMNAARNREALAGAERGAGLRGLDEACVTADTAGIGDIVKPATPIRRHVIMINPGVPVSTAEVYKEIDGLPEELRRPGGLWTNMMEEWTLRNVAEAAELKATMQAKLRAERVLMSGSGPTMVAFYEDAESAEEDFENVRTWAKDGWRAWLTESGKE